MAKIRGVPPANYEGKIIHLKESKYIRKMKNYRKGLFVSLIVNIGLIGYILNLLQII